MCMVKFLCSKCLNANIHINSCNDNCGFEFISNSELIVSTESEGVLLGIITGKTLSLHIPMIHSNEALLF